MVCQDPLTTRSSHYKTDDSYSAIFDFFCCRGWYFVVFIVQGRRYGVPTYGTAENGTVGRDLCLLQGLNGESAALSDALLDSFDD